MSDRSRLSEGEAFPFRTTSLRVGLAGAGRVGRAVARTLASRGHRIGAVATATPEGSAAAASEIGAAASDLPSLARGADLVVIAVHDDALPGVIADVARGCRGETWVVHTSGRSGAAVLEPCGERVAAVHPARPVPDAEASFDGVAFGVTCAEAAWSFAEWFVGQLGGFAVPVPEDRRVLYHSALVIASNFPSALAGDAIDLAPREVVLPLLRATVENLERMKPDEALTGPVVRGDAGTVREHLLALDAGAPHLREVYVANSRRILARAIAAGWLNAEDAARVEEALR